MNHFPVSEPNDSCEMTKMSVIDSDGVISTTPSSQNVEVAPIDAKTAYPSQLASRGLPRLGIFGACSL